jgi:hypothetical protein
MKHAPLAILAALTLSACAEGYYGPYGGGGLAYYDDYYGPFHEGYWGRDGAFYHRSGESRQFARDEGQHFRHAPAGGFHGVHASAGFHGGGHGGGGERH